MIPLLLVPGLLCDARLFAPQINFFSSQRPIHIGNITQESTIAAMAQQLLATAPPSFALAGLSLGGIVAMQLAQLAPERITHLALLDTNPAAETETMYQLRQRQIMRARSGDLPAMVRDELKPNYFAASNRRDELLDLCLDMAQRLGSQVFERQARALQTRPDQTAKLQHFNFPTLVLCGANDALCPPTKHQQMHAEIANSRLVIIPDAGHLPTIEQPDLTNGALQQWLTAA